MNRLLSHSPLALTMLLSYSCTTVDIHENGNLAIQQGIEESGIITCSCDKTNDTDDWVYCQSFTVNLENGKELTGAEMIYEMESRSVSSKVVAELYDISANRTITGSIVESKSTNGLHKVASSNISSNLNGVMYLTIRFKSTEDGAVGYLSGNNRLVLQTK